MFQDLPQSLSPSVSEQSIDSPLRKPSLACLYKSQTCQLYDSKEDNIDLVSDINQMRIKARKQIKKTMRSINSTLRTNLLEKMEAKRLLDSETIEAAKQSQNLNQKQRQIQSYLCIDC